MVNQDDSHINPTEIRLKTIDNTKKVPQILSNTALQNSRQDPKLKQTYSAKNRNQSMPNLD